MKKRLIISKNTYYDKLNVVIANQTITVRLLAKTDKEPNSSIEDLLKHDEDGGKEIVVKIDNEVFCVFASLCVNARSERFKPSMVPYGNIGWSFKKGESLNTVDFFADGYVKKTRAPYTAEPDTYTAFQYYPVDPTFKLEDAPMSFVVRSKEDLITNVNLDDVFEQDPEELITNRKASVDLFVHYNIDGPETIPENGTVDLYVRTYDSQFNPVPVNYDNFFIECVDGYAPHQRFAIKDGIGSFRVTALGLKAGEKMRVKIGTRIYSGISEWEMTVVP